MIIHNSSMRIFSTTAAASTDISSDGERVCKLFRRMRARPHNDDANDNDRAVGIFHSQTINIYRQYSDCTVIYIMLRVARGGVEQYECIECIAPHTTCGIRRSVMVVRNARTLLRSHTRD